MKKFAALLLLTLFGSCATGPPTAEEFAAADYGTPISQADAESQAEAWLASYLKDPSSAEKQWKPVGQGWLRDAPIYGGSIHWGYKLDGEINAKNSYGGFTGFKSYSFMFHNGQIQTIYGDQRMGDNIVFARIK